MSILIVDSNEKELQDQEALLKKAGYSSLVSIPSMQEAFKIIGADSRAPLGNAISVGLELVIVSIDSINQGSRGSLDLRNSFQWSIDELNCFLEECSEISRRVKNSFNYQDIPLIVVTSALNSEVLPFVIAYGAYDFIRKPYSPIEYLARVRSAIKLKHEMSERKSREKELVEATKQLAELNSMLIRLSLIDSMTGVPNRRSFDRILTKEWRKAIHDQSPLSLLMIDVDYFKDYNDHYGHQKGDECLKQVSRILKDNLEHWDDGIFRYGGEEFVIVLPNTPALVAEKVGESLRAAIYAAALPHEKSKTLKRVTISVGVATLNPSVRSDPKLLIETADQALYAAKKAGRNQVFVATLQNSKEAS